MNIKKYIFALIISLIFSGFVNAQEITFGKKESTVWRVVPEKSKGTASVKNGVITLTTFKDSTSDLFYILDQKIDNSNISVSYKIKPLNEESHTGVLLRYVSPDDWVYVGCDLTSDIFGYSAWYVETPTFRKEICRDIAKLYQNYTRNIRIDCENQAITLRIDNEIAAYINIPEIGMHIGKIGFRAHKGGAAVISDVVYEIKRKPHLSLFIKTISIQSDILSVNLASSFPSPLTYKWKNDTVSVNRKEYPYIRLNGTNYIVKGQGKQINNQTVVYNLEIPEVNVTMDVECKVQGHIFQTKITRLQEKGTFRVYTIGFPEQFSAAIPNTDSNAHLGVALSEATDRFFDLKTKTQDTIPQTATIAILNNNKIAITLDNNSIYESKQFIYQTDKQKTSIGNNEWIYRGLDGKITELPWYKVIFTEDRNNDGKVNWQDGAVALSEVYPDPYGVERVRNSNITITMNFASEAQFPFLRQLDNVKKIYYLTDGFRQMIELKGYQSEGHDTGHPDYAGNYNERAGGLKDLNTLVNEGKRYNAYIGLHINESEAHPAARTYDSTFMTTIPAWKWLDQAYLINKETDVMSGNFQKRLNNLKKDIDGLDFIYIDTYREHRYLAYNTAKLFNERGWAVWTEDPGVFNRYGTWIHYYPESKSLISRFIHGTRKDGFAEDSLFGGGYDRGAAIGFQGWQNGKNLYWALRNFYTIQLPYRYLMQSQVIYADSVNLRFKNGTEVRYANGVSSMYDNGRLIKKGNIIFIPWQEKIYHYNPEGGKTEWELPASWKGISQVYGYPLSDTGRLAVMLLPVANNRISINATKDVPYVIYKSQAPDLLSADWSHGSLIKDMGFDSKTFTYWKRTGNENGAQIETTTYGQSQLRLSGKEKTGVTQGISGLESGKSYSVWAWVEIKGKRRAVLEIIDANGKSVQTSIEETTIKNTQVNSDKRGGYYQLLHVRFTQPAERTTAEIKLAAEAVSDTSSVVFDDIRLLETHSKPKEGYVFYEDFENVDFGLNSWMLAKAAEDKIHLTELHKGYNDEDVINGNWSLKILDQGKGEIMRTMPSLISFAPNTNYKIRFEYSSSQKGSFEVVVRSAKADKILFKAPLDGRGLLEGSFNTENLDDCYIAIIESGRGMLIMDDFGISKF